MIVRENTKAAELIRSKVAVDPNRFRHLPDDIKARSFTVAYVHQVDVLERLRDKIARLPAGGDWKQIRAELAEEISPYMGGNVVAATKKAELLLRTHGYQAYAAGRYTQQMATKESMPYLMYITVGDANVRDEHAVLDGKVLPADDAFWQTHYPPWEFGCRCVVAAVSQAGTDAIKRQDKDVPPAERRVLEGKYLEDARKGRVARKDGRGYADVRPPKERAQAGANAYSWNPGEIAPEADVYKARLPAKEFKQLELELDKKGLEFVNKNRRVNIAKAAVVLDKGGWTLGRALPWSPGQKATRYELINKVSGKVVVKTAAEIKKFV